MSSGTQFVVAAYVVIWVILVLYVASMGLRTARLAREAELLVRLLDERDAAAAPDEAAGVGH
jgi:CcmD family protein